MAAAIYSTLNQEGVDVNQVFYLDTSTPEYPRPPFNPGTLAFGTDGSAWVYCTASITIGVGKVCIISDVPGSWSVALIGGATVGTAPTGQLLGVMSGSKGTLFAGAPSGTQTASFFWLQRAGNSQGLDCAAATTKEAQLFSSATVGGRVSSTGGGSGTTYSLLGLVVSQATGSAAGPNTAILNYPVVGSSG
jgi:hypothetical protein